MEWLLFRGQIDPNSNNTDTIDPWPRYNCYSCVAATMAQGGIHPEILFVEIVFFASIDERREAGSSERV